jgi:hypothetical protein
MLTAPSGSPIPSISRASSSASSGVSGDGLTTTEQPASSAGTSLERVVVWATFQGGIATTTPAGSRSTVPATWPASPSRSSSHGKRRACAAIARMIATEPLACEPVVQRIGAPISAVSVCPMSSTCAW